MTRHRLFAVAIVLAALLAAVPSAPHAAEPVPADTILFVCEHGSVKSLLASLLFDRAAARAGLPMRSMSRGTAPDAAVPQWLREALATDGIDVGAWQPAALTAADTESAKRVIVFDVTLSSDMAASAAMERWDSLPPVSKDYRTGRDAIAAKIDELVRELKAHATEAAR